MTVKSKLKNLAIVIDSISESQKDDLSKAAIEQDIGHMDFFSNRFSARKNLLDKFKKILLDPNKKISNEVIAKLETEYDLIIKVGKNSLEDAVIIGASYAEIYFADLDPSEFNQSELQKALEDFERRKRNFGV